MQKVKLRYRFGCWVNAKKTIMCLGVLNIDGANYYVYGCNLAEAIFQPPFLKPEKVPHVRLRFSLNHSFEEGIRASGIDIVGFSYYATHAFEHADFEKAIEYLNRMNPILTEVEIVNKLKKELNNEWGGE